MSRIIARCTLIALFMALASSVRAREDLPHREILGPMVGPTERPLLVHMEQVVFSPDGTTMAAGGGNEIILWNVSDGKEIRRLSLPTKQTSHRLCFGNKGNTLIWCGWSDPLVRIFDVATGRQIREFRQPHGQYGEEFSTHFRAFSPDGKRMVFAGAKFFNDVDVVDVATGKISLRISCSDCRCCAFSPDGKQIVLCSTYGSVSLVDARTEEVIHKLRRGQNDPGVQKSAAFSADSKYLATGDFYQHGVEVWNTETGKMMCNVLAPSSILQAVFTEDGQSLLCIDRSGKPFLYNLYNENVIQSFEVQFKIFHSANFTPDSQFAACITHWPELKEGGYQGSIYLYRLPARLLNPPTAQFDDAPLDDLWRAFTTTNEFRLQRIEQAFRAAPKQTVQLFRSKVSPVLKARVSVIERWIADLNDPSMHVRDRADQNLRAVVHEFSPLLKDRCDKQEIDEFRLRLVKILFLAESDALPEGLTRDLRAVAVLEQLATPEARKLLSELADGAPLARLTVAAREALDRMAKASKAEK